MLWLSAGYYDFADIGAAVVKALNEAGYAVTRFPGDAVSVSAGDWEVSDCKFTTSRDSVYLRGPDDFNAGVPASEGR